MSELSNLPGVTLDPKDESGLEAAFGVTSNAEELVKANRGRYTPEHRKVLLQDENLGATDSLHELDDDGNRIGLKDDLAKTLDHPVETATVRGTGRNAVISYTYVGDRGSIEKGIIPYAEVFGSASAKRAARREQAGDPSEAGAAAAEAKLDEAQAKAAAAIQEAQDKARELVEDAQKQIADLLAKANEDAEAIRAKAAEEAPKAADDAEKKAAAAKSRSRSSS
jgi:hypothetical protein